MEQRYSLKNIDIYEGIPEASFCEIAPHSFEDTYKKGHQIYTPHQKDGKIYVIKRGEVILYHSKDGKRSIFDTLGPGAVFGSFDLENDTPNHFAETTKGSYLCVTPVNEFLKIISAHPESMLKLMQKMATRINDYEFKIQNNIEAAAERIYQELQRLHKKRQHSLLGKMMNIPLQVTHEQIAERTNLNRVTVTRCLKRLKNQGLVTIEKGTGIIHLRDIAEV
ncbi:Crp/Fnr family transcriptional regulator [Candidatus Peregrinibacteria bacterium]|nr:MAG: Crp/Fnr family transcriptional regulator [Candidatus Peregrinibacteria bacterium]